MTELSVSYVVTIYNKSNFIPYVVEAIFNQEGVTNGEYIFVDDGSTDDSLDALHRCTQGHDNVKIIHQKNAGPAPATNRGIAEATRPYIKFVDGDDILHPRSTLELFNAMNKHGVDLAHTHVQQFVFPADLSTVLERAVPDVDSYLIADSLSYVAEKALFNLTCVLVSTQLAKDVGGCDERVFIQDYSIILRLANRTSIAVVPKILAFCPVVEADDRASALAGGGQVLHDLNLASGYFMHETEDIPRPLQYTILRKTTGRAWKWARRRGRKSFFSRQFMNYLLAKLAPQALDIPGLILASCTTFRETSSVRLAQRLDGQAPALGVPRSTLENQDQ